MKPKDPRYNNKTLDNLNFAYFYSAPGSIYKYSKGSFGNEVYQFEMFERNSGHKVHFFDLNGKRFALFDCVIVDNPNEEFLTHPVETYRKFISDGLGEEAQEWIIPINALGHFVLLTLSFHEDTSITSKIYDSKGKFLNIKSSRRIHIIKSQLENLFKNICYEPIFLNNQAPTDMVSCGLFVPSYIKSIAHGQDIKWASKGSVTLTQMKKRDDFLLHAYNEAKSQKQGNILLQRVNPIKIGERPLNWDAEIGRELFSQIIYGLNSLLLDEGPPDNIKLMIRSLMTKINGHLHHATPNKARILYHALSAIYNQIKHNDQQACAQVLIEMESHLSDIPWLRIVIASILVLALLALAVTLIVALATPAAPISMAILGFMSNIFIQLSTLVAGLLPLITGASISASMLTGGAMAAIITTTGLSGAVGITGLVKLGFFSKQQREDDNFMKEIKNQVTVIGVSLN